MLSDLARLRHGAPDRSTQKMPLRTRGVHSVHASRLYGNIGLMAAYS
jgi:hypothetical protein